MLFQNINFKKMIKSKIILTILLVCGIIFLTAAQSKREQRWQQAIDQLEKSDLVLRYDELKKTIEEQVAEFHVKKAPLHPDDVADVKKAYQTTVVKFDNLLDELKNAFLNPASRKEFAQNPDQFTHFMQVELNDAFTHYNNQCKQAMDALIEFDHPQAMGLMEISMMIALGKELWQLWENQSAKANKQASEYFERVFITQHRLKKWEDY